MGIQCCWGRWRLSVSTLSRIMCLLWLFLLSQVPYRKRVGLCGDWMETLYICLIWPANTTFRNVSKVSKHYITFVNLADLSSFSDLMRTSKDMQRRPLVCLKTQAVTKRIKSLQTRPLNSTTALCLLAGCFHGQEAGKFSALFPASHRRWSKKGFPQCHGNTEWNFPSDRPNGGREASSRPWSAERPSPWRQTSGWNLAAARLSQTQESLELSNVEGRWQKLHSPELRRATTPLLYKARNRRGVSEEHTLLQPIISRYDPDCGHCKYLKTDTALPSSLCYLKWCCAPNQERV